MIIDGYRPGDLAAVIGLHMDYYAAQWNFGLAFETKIASELAEFLGRFDAQDDLFVCARNADDRVVASISVDRPARPGDFAHLRWFVVSRDCRGKGLGRRLMDRAVSHCRDNGYGGIYLTTFAGLDAARHLYEAFGFRLVSETDVDQWQGGVREQRFELVL